MLQGAEPPGSRVWEIQRDEGGYTLVIRANKSVSSAKLGTGTSKSPGTRTDTLAGPVSLYMYCSLGAACMQAMNRMNC